MPFSCIICLEHDDDFEDQIEIDYEEKKKSQIINQK